MAEQDFFAYERAHPGSILMSSDYASVYFANSDGTYPDDAAGKAGLVQSAAISYQQNVQPRFEAGSHELRWLTGQSMGSVQIGRLIGDQGLLAGISMNSDPNDLRKGVLGGIEFKIGRNNLTGISMKQEVLVLSGCVMSQYGISFNVGSLEIQESMTIQTALIKRATLSEN